MGQAAAAPLPLRAASCPQERAAATGEGARAWCRGTVGFHQLMAPREHPEAHSS